MKTVLFLRHGKSDWKADYGDDHERPLAKRGRKAAKVMGVLMSQVDQTPDSIVSSSAVRALRTVELAHKEGGWHAPIRVVDELYGASPEEVLGVMRREPDSTDSLLVVSHEPTCSETVGRLIGGGTVRYPTAAMARIDLDIPTWQEAAFGTGQLIWLLPPRLFT